MGKETNLELEPQRQSATLEEPSVRCAACGHGLTKARARVAVGGGHIHTFVNPAGEQFTLRCFTEAPGCAGMGPESTFWSWFPGFAWRVALCSRCAQHVGWSFHRADGVFWGLIVERIVV